MPSIPFYQVDAFAWHPFAGNPAAILVLDAWLPDEVMQAIAQENNIAITAFVRRNGAVWDLRWFTPSMEASFCGHGTLATAHVLAAELGIGGDFAFTARPEGCPSIAVPTAMRWSFPACRRKRRQSFPPTC